MALRYAKLNPVRAGLVERAEDWPWSSAAAHGGRAKPQAWLDLRALRLRDPQSFGLHRPPNACYDLWSMSIYATLWTLKFPRDGDDFHGCDWIEVTAQGVPPHVGSPSPGAGYEGGDPFGAFLPPPVPVNADGDAPHMRAVVIVTEFTKKGTERSGQEYQSPLLVLTGEEYDKITFAELHERICSSLRGNRAPVVAQIFRPDGSSETIRALPKDPGRNQ